MIALLVEISDTLLSLTDDVAKCSGSIGLRISDSKPKAIIIHHQSASPINIDQQTNEYVNSFQYVGSYISGTGDSGVDVHIGNAAIVFR